MRSVLQLFLVLCSQNVSVLRASTCSGALSFSDTDYGEVTVSISAIPTNRKCQFTIVRWNGSTSLPVAKSRISADCSSVSFRSNDIAMSFGYSSNYQFSLQMFQYGDSVDQDAAECTLSPAASTLYAPDCDASHLTLVRRDPNSVSVTVSSTYARSYMLCRVTLLSLTNTLNTGSTDGPASDMVRIGACTDRFDFIKETGNAWTLVDGNNFYFTLEQFPTGDIGEIASAAGCTTLVGAAKQVSAFSSTCSALTIPRLPGALYSFQIANHPLGGTCTLTRTSAGGGTYVLPDCADVMVWSLADINTKFGAGSLPGVAATFTWSLSGLASACTSGVATIARADAFIDIEASVVTYSAVTIRIPLVELSVVGETTCNVRLLSCDGSATMTTTQSFTCPTLVSSAPTATISSLSAYESCVFRAEITKGAAISYSDELSVAIAAVPAWTGSPTPTITVYGDDCLLVSWDAPDASGGTPLLCYIVERQDDGNTYYEVGNSCDELNPNASFITPTSFVSCGFSVTIPYNFRISAQNRLGVSITYVESSLDIYTEYLLAAPDSVYTSPALADMIYAAGSFPMIIVQEMNPDGSPAADNTPTDRLFVGRLVNRGKLDVSGSVFTELEDLSPDNVDYGYTVQSLPIEANSPPAFTKVYVSAGSGLYNLITTVPPLAGVYSLATYSLESGGLLGQYWTNPWLFSTAQVEEKDPNIDFEWNLGPLLETSGGLLVSDLVSIRWTGFIEADFSEEYTFYLATNNDKVRMWIDDVIVINSWTTACIDECTGRAELLQSVVGFGSRQFHHVRIEYQHMKGASQSKNAVLSLSWSSFSQPKEVIPTTQLFKGVVIDVGDTSQLKPITVVPDVLHPATSVLTVPFGPFVAGEEYILTVQAKDVYGNNLDSLAHSFIATFTGPATVVASSAPDDSSVANGLYKIPFVLTTSGDYTIAVTDSAAVSVASASLTVSPGNGAQFSATPLLTQLYVDVPAVITALVQDDNSNNLLSSSDVPPIYVTAQWTGDAVTEGRLLYDDYELRRERFGDYFTQSAVAYDSPNTYTASISLPRAGTYDIEVGILGGDAPVPLATTTMMASKTIAPQYSVVTTASFPPTSLTAGTQYTYTVQLRDEFMNALGEAADGSPTVQLRLEKYTGTNEIADTLTFADDGCVVSITLAGQWTCKITPTVAISEAYMSILVDGVHASYMGEIDGEIRHFQGPWVTSVVAAANSPADCSVTGLRSTYTAGLQYDTTIVLKDAYDNIITTPTNQGASVIAVTISKLTETTDTMSTSTFVFNDDGTVTIPIIPITASNGRTLQITFGSGPAVTCSSSPVDVVVGTIVSASSTCAEGSWSATQTAGTLYSIGCTPKDAGNNPKSSLSNLYTIGDCKHRTDSATEVTNSATYSTPVYTYPMTLTKSGPYSCYFLMGQPGGLIGQYYSDDDFNELIGVDNAPLVDARHYNEPPLEYTRIDSYLDFDWGGPILINDITVKSIMWTGYLIVTADTYAITVTASGGTRVTLHTSDMLGSFDQLDEATTSSTITGIVIAAASQILIEIEYIPRGIPSFSLEWSYTTDGVSGYWTVPASAFQSPLKVAKAVEVITVNPGVISVKSVAYVPAFFVAGTDDTFTIQAIDTYGNLRTATTTGECTGLGFVLTPADGSTIAVASNDSVSGICTVEVNFVTDGPKQLDITLSTVALIGGSLYFDVYPAS